MEFIAAMIVSFIVSAIVSLIWVKGLSEYYDSWQYEKDVKDGLYNGYD